MKMIIKKSTVFVFAVAGICCTLSAQSLKWADGKEFVRKLSNTLYEPVPAGIVSYKIENNQCRMLFNGVPTSDKPKIYCSHVDGKYAYYNGDDNILGSYIPSQGRYYVISSKGNEILKEESLAVLINGALYLNTGEEPVVKYMLDEGFDPIVVGFFLFDF